MAGAGIDPVHVVVARVASQGDAISRVGLTMQQLMGVPLDGWGTGSMRTNRSISEIMV